MNSLKITRRDYQRATQSALADFAEDVFKRMNGVAAYEDLQPYVQALSPALDAYREALFAARNRGRVETLAKTLAQETLIQQLDMVAITLEVLARGNAQLIVGAGFSIRPVTQTSFSGKLPKPVIVRANSTGNRGEVRINIDNLVPTGVATNYALEYSLDRQNGWQNGTYHSRRNFVAADLPAATELWLRIKTLGRSGNQSDWSEPVMVGVL